MKGCQKFYVDLIQDISEVTGSCEISVANIDEKVIKYAVDCGLYQEKDYEQQNQFFLTNPEELEFVIITHNHLDHTGRLPYLVKSGFKGKIFMTKATKIFIGRALYDNARILKDNGKRRNKEALYDEADVRTTLSLIVECDYNTPIRVNDNITITFIPNGHLLGSALVLVQIHYPGEPKDINLLYTGDYNNRNLFFKVAPIRRWITDLPINIIIESTYGDINSNEVHKVFERNMISALKNKKTIIIPVFSLGRAQEILYFFRYFQKKYPKLIEDFDIFYDGKLSFFYTDMYYEFQRIGLLKFYKDKKDFLPENLIKVENKILRRQIVASKNKKIIITTSGMGSYGPAQSYIPSFIRDESALIHFTGYCSEDSMGYRLKNTQKGDIVEVGGIKAIKMADVEFTSEWSAHAKADDLIKLLKKFNKLQFVLVNHGRQETKDIFSKRILREVGTNYVGILGREYIYRIDKDGFVKSFISELL